MIVIGVVAGVIVATVAVIIPWAQDEAAKGNLHAFGDANAVAHVTDGAWLDTAGLIGRKFLPANAATGDRAVRSALGDDCYVLHVSHGDDVRVGPGDDGVWPDRIWFWVVGGVRLTMSG